VKSTPSGHFFGAVIIATAYGRIQKAFFRIFNGIPNFLSGAAPFLPNIVVKSFR